MLTSYFVKCPNLGCDWLGSQLPRRDAGAIQGIAPPPSTVAFQCPRCRGEWKCRVVGDDVVPIDVNATSVVGAV